MYKVILSACGNPDHNESAFHCVVNGKYVKGRIAKASSIAGCVTITQNYITNNDLGAGNWTGGKVYDKDDNYVGRISYNGRFWDKETEYGKEKQ